MSSERNEVVFLVRMWQPGGTQSAWRGSVHEIGSDLRYYVTETRDLAEFINSRLAVERPEE